MIKTQFKLIQITKLKSSLLDKDLYIKTVKIYKRLNNSVNFIFHQVDKRMLCFKKCLLQNMIFNYDKYCCNACLYIKLLKQ